MQKEWTKKQNGQDLNTKSPTLLVAHLQFLQTHKAKQKQKKSHQANAQRQTRMSIQATTEKGERKALTAPCQKWRFSHRKKNL